ncbi:MAG: VTT domain-containing protein [Geminicoccaceae bacterium]|nr:VTT domain-containing protein [Geminicoccaceae bacterium]MCX8101590.1 VTT domain-containing protein [Geminicoccaceae bacterium]MDW8369863.1 VTT domain-containing protein [Geminicoccaceae bacterium]
MRRLFLVFLILAGLVLVPFLLWGEALEAALDPAALAARLEAQGPLAAIVAIGLLWCDLLLPIPATAVMSALGFVYGVLWGALLGAIGSILAGLTGYALCRALGPAAARRILGEDGLEQGERLFARVGAWLVLLSRWLPVFPEVVACMAGLARMHFPTFLAALAAGSLPMAAAFAALGRFGIEQPGIALALSALAPPSIWLLARPLALRLARAGADDRPDAVVDPGRGP